MNALNGFCNSLFNILFAPFDELFGLGALVTITAVSIVFMPLSMLFFKRFSSQSGIAAAKGKIKGHMIEIRIYQDDLGVVIRAVGKVLYYNSKYLFLNFAPFIPISVPFVLVVAQLVVRFGFAPIPIEHRDLSGLQAGQGVTISVRMQPGHETAAGEVRLMLPDTLQAVSPLVRSAADGVAFQEVVAVAAGARDIRFEVNGQTVTKRIVTGTGNDIERQMQPERVNDFWLTWLWPAESTFGADSSFQTVSFVYPDRELKWMPDGAEGVFLMFLIVSFVIGGAAIKLFDIQI